MCKYFRENKLSLHPDKTKYLVISSSKQVQELKTLIFINNNNSNSNDLNLFSEISRIFPDDKTPAIKYLGVYFDPNINFKFHIQSISSKLSKAIYILRRVKNFLPASALKTLYFSLFHCHLIYAAEIWGCASKNVLTPIFLKQKQAIRILSNKKYNSHTEPLFKQNKILPFFDLLEFMKIKFMHSFYFKNLPSSLSNMWTLKRTRNQVQELPALRNEDDFYIPFARTDQTSLLPQTSFPKLWNLLPQEIRSIQNKFSFSNKLKDIYLSKLSDVPQCTRLLCPVCHL